MLCTLLPPKVYKRIEFFSYTWETLTKRRFLLCSVPLEWISSQTAWETFQEAISDYVLWCHQAWENGIVPERCFSGKAYSPTGYNKELAGKRLSHKAVLLGFKADCKGRNEMHAFQTSYRSNKICDRCPATAYGTTPRELCFVNHLGLHRLGKMTQREFLRETQSPWRKLPGLHYHDTSTW